MGQLAFSLVKLKQHLKHLKRGRIFDIIKLRNKIYQKGPRMNYNINHIQLKDLPTKLIQFRLQEKYDQDFQKVISSRSCTQCTTCGSKEFQSHGFYERYVYLNKTRHILLRVMRKMCLSCGKTRVFLPSYLVKYKRYTVQYLFKLICKISSSSLNHVHKKLNHSLGYLFLFTTNISISTV